MKQRAAAGIYELWDVGKSWAKVDSIVGKNLDSGDKEFLKGCLSPRCKTLLVEREYIDKDYRNAYSAHYSKKFQAYSTRCVRVHAFDVEVREADVFGLPATSSLPGRLEEICRQSKTPVYPRSSPGYMGYVVLRPTPYSRVGRCLLDPRKTGKHELRTGWCLANYSASVMGHELEVAAFPHQAQDAEVHTCAETAVWALFRYLSQRYRQYKEHYPYDVSLLADGSTGRRLFPSRGLTMDQIASMFGRSGLGAELYLPSNDVQHPAQDEVWTGSRRKSAVDDLIQYFCIYLESGLPPIVGLPGHAVVANGLVYSDKPLGRRKGRVIPAADFVSAVVVNDDNWHPYQSLHRSIADARTSPSGFALRDVDSLVVPMPEKVMLAAEDAEELIAEYFALFLDATTVAPLDERLVRRTVLTSTNNYKACQLRNGDAVSAFLASFPMPHFVWIGELYPLTNWRSRRAVAEVVLDATAGALDEEPFLWVRTADGIWVNEFRLLGEGQPRWYDSAKSTGMGTGFSGFGGNLVEFTPSSGSR